MQLIHNFVVFWMIGSQHKEGVITHLAKILKRLNHKQIRKYRSLRGTKQKKCLIQLSGRDEIPLPEVLST